MQSNHKDIFSPTKEQPFTHFDLHLTEVERNALDNMIIEKQIGSAAWIFDNKLDVGLKEIEIFINSIGSNNQNITATVNQLVMRIIQDILHHFNQQCAYIILRTFTHEGFNLPRWHQDGHYYSPYTIDQDYEDSHTPVVKAAVPLIGAGTLFYKLPAEQSGEFKKLKNNREQLAEFLNDESRKENTPREHGSLFIVGQKSGAVHSEPHITKPRFFMSVLPGTKDQINENQTCQKICDQIQEKYNKIMDQLRLEGKSKEEISNVMNTMIEEINNAMMEFNKSMINNYSKKETEETISLKI